MLFFFLFLKLGRLIQVLADSVFVLDLILAALLLDSD